MNTFPKVGIGIVTYNNEKHIYRLFKDLEKISCLISLILIIDNCSTDKTVDLIESHSRQIFQKKGVPFEFSKNQTNIGFARGANIILRKMVKLGFEWILLLNPDVRLTEDFLSNLINCAEQKKEVGIISPMIIKESGKIWFAGGKINWLAQKCVHFTKFISNNSVVLTEYVPGTAMLIKSEVLRKVGFFDEDFFLYYEDADLCFRARNKGYKVAVCLKSKITHLESQSFFDESVKIENLVKSGLIFFKKNTAGFLKLIFWIKTLIRFSRLKLMCLFKSNLKCQIMNRAFKEFFKYEINYKHRQLQ